MACLLTYRGRKHNKRAVLSTLQEDKKEVNYDKNISKIQANR